jgi:hypothetical protein
MTRLSQCRPGMQGIVTPWIGGFYTENSESAANKIITLHLAAVQITAR